VVRQMVRCLSIFCVGEVDFGMENEEWMMPGPYHRRRALVSHLDRAQGVFSRLHTDDGEAGDGWGLGEWVTEWVSGAVSE